MNLLDAVLLLLTLLFALGSMRKGLLRSLAGLLADVLSAVGAKLAAPYVSRFVYDRYMKQNITDTVSVLFPSSSVTGNPADRIREIIESSAIPEAVKDIMKRYRLLPDRMKTPEFSFLDTGSFEPKYIGPIVVKALSIIAVAVLFAVFMIILNILFGMIAGNITRSHRLVKTVDKALGAAFGVFKSAVVLFFVCVILFAVSSVAGSENLLLLVDGSYFCNFAASFFM